MNAAVKETTNNDTLLYIIWAFKVYLIVFSIVIATTSKKDVNRPIAVMQQR